MRLAPIVLVACVLNPALADNPVAQDPYKAKTWIDKLGDAKDSERAVTQLEQLGDPSAIAPLGEAWLKQGRPVRIMQVIISLARPLTPAAAKAAFVTDYEKSGRPASWDKALPYLTRALTEIDDTSPRSVDSAVKAAGALGEANLAGGIEPLVGLVSKPSSKKLIAAQISAVRALGSVTSAKPKATAALVKILQREPPPRTRSEDFSMYLATSGAAINALGELRDPAGASELVLAMYRTPELFMQIRRALAALGPTAKKLVVAALRGTNADVNRLFKTKRLDKACDATGGGCQPVSAKDFYSAIVIGDFYDPATVTDLLAALKRPALPAYVIDDQPGPSQYNAIFDALRKIGAPAAAAPLRALWSNAKTNLDTRVLAISAYPFVARDTTGIAELGKITKDNTADDQLRTEAATAYARMSSDVSEITMLTDLAQKYVDASTTKAKEAASHRKEADAADKDLAAEKAKLEAAKATALRTARDTSASVQQIKDATEAAKRAEDAYKAAKKTHKERTSAFKMLDSAATAYMGYARMFQTHVARIEIAARCKADAACYAAALTAKPADVIAANAKYIKDVGTWSDDEKRELVAAASERAALELGKLGAKAKAQTDALLDAAASEQRLVRQSALLALPKVAALPCPVCVTKLDAAVKSGEGKTALGDLVLETTMMRNYFAATP